MQENRDPKPPKPSLIGMTLKELETLFLERGEERFRAEQVAGWIYRKGISSIEGMANIPRPLRRKLEENFTLFTTRLEDRVDGEDNTTKALIRLHDHACVEGVVIRRRGETRLLVSVRFMQQGASVAIEDYMVEPVD